MTPGRGWGEVGRIIQNTPQCSPTFFFPVTHTQSRTVKVQVGGGSGGKMSNSDSCSCSNTSTGPARTQAYILHGERKSHTHILVYYYNYNSLASQLRWTVVYHTARFKGDFCLSYVRTRKEGNYTLGVLFIRTSAPGLCKGILSNVDLEPKWRRPNPEYHKLHALSLFPVKRESK